MSPEDPVIEALDRCGLIPLAALHAAFNRYGMPLEALAPPLDPVRVLEDGATRIGRFRYRSPVDVIDNDHFLFLTPGEEPLSMPGPLFASLVAALSRKRG